MREDLLGYLLGALDPHEMRQVEQSLRESPALRDQLADLERSLRPLSDGLDLPEPPATDLVSRTLDALPLSPDGNSDGVLGERLAQGVRSTPQEESAIPVLSHSDERTPGSNRFRPTDLLVSAAAAITVMALLLPAIWNGRFEARKIACQDQLRRFGTALTHFVTRSEQKRLPAVASSGVEAFAGMYAVRLADAGLLEDSTMRWCPSFDLPETILGNERLLTQRVSRVPDLYAASVDRLRELQRVSGGHYAYTLGVRQDGEFASPRYQDRGHFAVMSDMPIGFSLQQPLSLGLNRPESFRRGRGHSGEGLNVLFEDGHVQFVRLDRTDLMPDNPWLNHHGDQEAGIHIDDASLAPSWQPPFRDSLQR